MNDNIIFLLELSVLTLIMAVALGSLYIKLFILPDIRKLEEKSQHMAFEIEQLKAKQRVYEKRLMRAEVPEKIVISHEYSERNAPTFGGF